MGRCYSSRIYSRSSDDAGNDRAGHRGSLEPLRTKPVDQKTLDRALVKLRSDLYDTIGGQGGFGLVDLLASFALFDDNPARVNALVGEYEKVTPALIQKTAQEYLRPENRTVLLVEPGQPAAAPDAKSAPQKDKLMERIMTTRHTLKSLLSVALLGVAVSAAAAQTAAPPAAAKNRRLLRAVRRKHSTFPRTKPTPCLTACA